MASLEVDKRKKIVPLVLAILVLAIFSILISSSNFNFVAPQPTTATSVCTYLIYTDGTNYYSQNCSNSAIEFDGKDATQIIEKTLNACTIRCSILFKSGRYALSSPVASSADNITFEGSGWSTIFTLSRNFSGVPLRISGQGWLVQDFQIDASNQLHTNQSSTIDLNGKNNVVKHVFVSGGDFGAIRLQGERNTAKDNYLFNLTNDGIIALNAKGAIVEDNVVNVTQRHNGISLISTTNSLVTGNVVIHPALYGIGLEAASFTGTSGTTCQNDTASHNIIVGGRWGIALYNNANGTSV